MVCLYYAIFDDAQVKKNIQSADCFDVRNRLNGFTLMNHWISWLIKFWNGISLPFSKKKISSLFSQIKKFEKMDFHRKINIFFTKLAQTRKFSWKFHFHCGNHRFLVTVSCPLIFVFALFFSTKNNLSVLKVHTCTDGPNAMPSHWISLIFLFYSKMNIFPQSFGGSN